VSAPPSPPAPPRRARGRDALWTALLCAAAVAGIASLRGALFGTYKHAKNTSDLYVLPPPKSVVALSLGYRSALADYLWADTLVQQGLRIQERRRYEHITLYVETINELDPTYRDPYLVVDALVTFQFGETPMHEIAKTREILEFGARALPNDGEVWLSLGQFVTFLAPGGYIKDPAQIEQWRTDGARYLAKAAELSGKDSNIAWQALAGAGILGKRGDREAQIRFLKRTLAVTDDDELRADVLRRLSRLLSEDQIEEQKRRDRLFVARWQETSPFVSRTAMIVLGPQPDPYACAGERGRKAAECARTWAERGATERELPAPAPKSTTKR